MINISLILALRGQKEVFERMMQSLEDTTRCPLNIEVLVVIDDDDRKTIANVRFYENKFARLNLRFLMTKRSIYFVRDYYNWAGRQALGRWMIDINADSLFMTKEWDVLLDEGLSKAAKEFGDDILLGIINDGLPRCNDGNVYPEGMEVWGPEVNFCCWPIVSKEYVHLTGGIMDDRIPAWGADFALGYVFDSIDNGRRKVFLRHIFIDHISSHTKPKVPRSEHYHNFSEILQKNRSNLTSEELQVTIDKVNAHISKRI